VAFFSSFFNRKSYAQFSFLDIRKYPSIVSGENASIEKRQGSESLTNQNNGMLWTGSVGFGTPAVYFPIE
jgi:hypothetical protein